MPGISRTGQRLGFTGRSRPVIRKFVQYFCYFRLTLNLEQWQIIELPNHWPSLKKITQIHNCQRASRAKTLGWWGGSIIEPCESSVLAEKISSDLKGKIPECKVRSWDSNDVIKITTDQSQLAEIVTSRPHGADRHFFVRTTHCRQLWSTTEEMHCSLESIC